MSRCHLNAELRLVADLSGYLKKVAQEREDAIAENLSLKAENRGLIEELRRAREQKDD